MGHQYRGKRQVANNLRHCAAGKKPQHQQGKKDAEIPKDQLAGEAAKLAEKP